MAYCTHIGSVVFKLSSTFVSLTFLMTMKLWSKWQQRRCMLNFNKYCCKVFPYNSKKPPTYYNNYYFRVSI